MSETLVDAMLQYGGHSYSITYANLPSIALRWMDAS